MECVVDTGSSAYVAKMSQNAAAMSAHSMPAGWRTVHGVQGRARDLLGCGGGGGR
jgi:hypothetical protein